MGELTYDDIRKASEALEKQEVETKVMVFHSTVISYLNKHGFIRIDGKRMFIQNYHYLPWLNGIEVFASDNVPSPKHGYEVSKIIFDELGEDNGI